MRWHRLWGIVVVSPVCICSWYPKACASVRDQGHGEWFRRGGVGKKKACLGGGVSIENPGVHPTSVWVFQLVVSLRLSWMYRQWMIQARVRFLPSLSRSLTRDFRPSSHGSSSTIRPVNSSRRRGTRYNVSHIPGCWCSAVPDLSGRWAARKSVFSTPGRSFHLIPCIVIVRPTSSSKHRLRRPSNVTYTSSIEESTTLERQDERVSSPPR